MRVAAVVVTYNRKELLARTVFALAGQSSPVARIHIVDNASSDGTFAYLAARGITHGPMPEEGTITSTLSTAEGRRVTIVYTRLSTNIGGAGGFSRGMERALAGGEEWIWMMDDDARPEPDALARLTPYFNRREVAALCGSVVGVDGEIQESHRGMRRARGFFPLHSPLPREQYRRSPVSVDMASFVGVLVRADVARRIGLPEERFFIHYDDVEFSLRLRAQGRILLVPESRIIHDDALNSRENRKELLGRRFQRISDSRIWLSYFGPRNIVFLARGISDSIPFFLLNLALFSLRQVCGILLFDRHKRTRITCFLNAVRDGFKGDFTRPYPFALKNRGVR